MDERNQKTTYAIDTYMLSPLNPSITNMTYAAHPSWGVSYLHSVFTHSVDSKANPTPAVACGSAHHHRKAALATRTPKEWGGESVNDWMLCDRRHGGRERRNFSLGVRTHCIIACQEGCSEAANPWLRASRSGSFSLPWFDFVRTRCTSLKKDERAVESQRMR